MVVVGSRGALYEPGVGEAVSEAYADGDFAVGARRHFAGWGEGWLHLAPLIGEEVRAQRADVVLVSLGLIDLGFYTDPRQTAENVRAFVTGAREGRPSVRMVMLPVVPNTRARLDPGFAGQCEEFNGLLGKAVAELTTDASPLLLAGPPPGWDVDTDTYDGTHPNAAGEHRIAAAFADALHEAWDIGAPYDLPF